MSKTRTFIFVSRMSYYMALTASPLDAKLKPCLRSVYSLTQRSPSLSMKCYNPKLSTSKLSISKPSLSISHKSILRKRRETTTRLLASVGNDEETHSPSTDHAIAKWAKAVFTGNMMQCGWTGFTAVGFMHCVALFAPFTFTWEAFWVAFVLYVLTGMLGVCLSFHRMLSHRSFKLPKWLEYFCAYCGVLALQGNPIDWASTHRYHHQYCDTKRDPHSPLEEGFWFGHMGWIYNRQTVMERVSGEPNNVADLEKQPFYRFMRSTYLWHSLVLSVILYAVGGFPYYVWGMGVRTVLVYHAIFLINSASHLWGSRPWNTSDSSRNNWFVGLVAFGEGWHNNHHAFEYSARHGLEWWQIDMTWYTIRFFQAIGLATDVKLPIEAHKKRMAIKSEVAA